MKNVIIISAHPDDETLGVGGTILKHVAKGDNVFWLIVTNIFENNGYSNEIVTNRQLEIKEVGRLFGFTKTYMLNYATMTLSSGSLIKLVPDISSIFLEVKPEIIYTLNRSDAHSDHRVIFNAVMACTQSFRYPFIKQVLMYECISETDFAPALAEKVFLPNYFVDITDFIDKKNEIMSVFKSELGEHPFPRSLENIKALSHFRGASVGVKFAEAFQLLKFIDK